MTIVPDGFYYNCEMAVNRYKVYKKRKKVAINKSATVYI